MFSLAKKLNKALDPWQCRLSLVLVEVYTKDQKMHAAINDLIIPLEGDKAYYVKKAVEWLKRNMNKNK